MYLLTSLFWTPKVCTPRIIPSNGVPRAINFYMGVINIVSEYFIEWLSVQPWRKTVSKCLNLDAYYNKQLQT